MKMIEIDAFARQVLKNCEISDARHAGLFSVCGLALRLRDLYKWENELNPWEEKDSSEILDWIGAKEQLWEKLAEKKFTDLSIGGKHYDPFNTAEINAVLEPQGVLYGAGYAYSLKPTFFLAAIKNKSQIDGYTVYTLERELARDLLTLPALSQDNLILLRTDSARLFLWDQIAFIKKSGRPALQFALEHCGLKEQDSEALRHQMPTILAAQKDNFIYHEIGEMKDSTFDPVIWRELIAAFPHSPIELLARAVKDLLADTTQHGTLCYLIRNHKTAALGFYAAFQDGLIKELFPELRAVFRDFTKTRDWGIIEEAVATGYRNAKNFTEKIVHIFETGKQNQQLQWAKNEIERRLLGKIKK
ncbi:MAG: hypothetical protein OET63_04100 [Desulfobacterales bacterium]|jgi:hypothetical protein|nr:hypothetical protein [Desulfobacterales bacterium]